MVKNHPDLFERISSASYANARMGFGEAVDRVGDAGIAVQRRTYKLKHYMGPDGEDLGIDVALVGDERATQLLVISSGTHGTEGFYGSAYQQRLLRHIVENRVALPPDTKLLLIHGVNPFGMAWWSRNEQGNVDMNRNFIDFSNPPPNEGYPFYHPYFSQIAWDWDIAKPLLWMAWIAVLNTLGLGKRQFKQMKHDAVGGQYTHPDGVFYGGHTPTWSHKTMLKVMQDFAKNVTQCIYIDLHTGLGPKGHVESIACPFASEEGRFELTMKLFPAVKSATKGDSVSALVTDHLRTGMMKEILRLNPECQGNITGVAFEVGTVPLKTARNALTAFNRVWVCGAAEAARALLVETTVTPEQVRGALIKWPEACFEQGIKAVLESEEGVRARKAVRDAFFINEKAWFDQVIAQTDASIAGLINRAVSRLSRQRA